MPSVKIAAITVLFVAGFSACRADLGETEAQCIARYGSEVDVQNQLGYHKVGDKAVTFNATAFGASLIVRVIFLNGKDCHEAISSADSSRSLSEDQMKAILTSESAGQKWRRGHSIYRTNRAWETGGVEDWVRTDGALARFWIAGKAASQNQTGEMELSTKQYAAAQDFYDKEDGAE